MCECHHSLVLLETWSVCPASHCGADKDVNAGPRTTPLACQSIYPYWDILSHRQPSPQVLRRLLPSLTWVGLFPVSIHNLTKFISLPSVSVCVRGKGACTTQGLVFRLVSWWLFSLPTSGSYGETGSTGGGKPWFSTLALHIQPCTLLLHCDEVLGQSDHTLPSNGDLIPLAMVKFHSLHIKWKKTKHFSAHTVGFFTVDEVSSNVCTL